MTHEATQELTSELEGVLCLVEPFRASDTLANELYEAAAYWLQLGRWVLEKNTMVDYPNRAREELVLLNELSTRLQLRYPTDIDDLLRRLGARGEALLKGMEVVRPLSGGHLGVLSAISKEFAFFEADYQMTKTIVSQLGISYSSPAAWVILQFAEAPEFTCAFGPSPRSEVEFELEDLLQRCPDRLKDLIEWRPLVSETEVSGWFHFVASAWKHCGQDILTNELGIFSRLKTGQSERDKALARSFQSTALEG